MKDEIKKQILNYLKSQSRNKIVFQKEKFENLKYIDVGLYLAQTLFSIKDESRIALKATGIIDELFKSSIMDHPDFGKILALSNIGILLEPDLKQDFFLLLDKFSKNNILFIHWEGQMDDKYLYFLSKERGMKFSLANVSHIIL